MGEKVIDLYHPSRVGSYAGHIDCSHTKAMISDESTGTNSQSTCKRVFHLNRQWISDEEIVGMQYRVDDVKVIFYRENNITRIREEEGWKHWGVFNQIQWTKSDSVESGFGISAIAVSEWIGHRWREWIRIRSGGECRSWSECPLSRGNQSKDPRLPISRLEWSSSGRLGSRNFSQDLRFLLPSKSLSETAKPS